MLRGRAPCVSNSGSSVGRSVECLAGCSTVSLISLLERHSRSAHPRSDHRSDASQGDAELLFRSTPNQEDAALICSTAAQTRLRGRPDSVKEMPPPEGASSWRPGDSFCSRTCAVMVSPAMSRRSAARVTASSLVNSQKWLRPKVRKNRSLSTLIAGLLEKDQSAHSGLLQRHQSPIMFSALRWLFVVAVLALWSMAAQALPAVAVWTAPKVDGLKGAGSGADHLAVPDDGLTPWTPRCTCSSRCGVAAVSATPAFCLHHADGPHRIAAYTELFTSASTQSSWTS